MEKPLKLLEPKNVLRRGRVGSLGTERVWHELFGAHLRRGPSAEGVHFCGRRGRAIKC